MVSLYIIQETYIAQKSADHINKSAKSADYLNKTQKSPVDIRNTYNPDYKADDNRSGSRRLRLMIIYLT